MPICARRVVLRHRRPTSVSKGGEATRFYVLASLYAAAAGSCIVTDIADATRPAVAANLLLDPDDIRGAGDQEGLGPLALSADLGSKALPAAAGPEPASRAAAGLHAGANGVVFTTATRSGDAGAAPKRDRQAHTSPVCIWCGAPVAARCDPGRREASVSSLALVRHRPKDERGRAHAAVQRGAFRRQHPFSPNEVCLMAV